WSSSDKWAIWNNGGYWIQNNVWGANPGPQTVNANYYGDWWVTANHSGGGIKSYPAVGKMVNKTVTSLQYMNSNFTAYYPSGVVTNLAYDVWLNGTTYEIMIWESWASGMKPIAATYDGSGNAIPTQTNVSIAGVTYTVYKRNNVISFLRNSQSKSSSVDLRAVLLWINNRGWYNNPTIKDVQFGFEIVSTGGTKTLGVTAYNMNFR
ncbi:MAG TPA: hypothetical protein VF595_15515, partial [Tepidisphaeraceae bacterium]